MDLVEPFQTFWGVNMECNDCFNSIRKSLSSLKGVHEVSHSLEKQILMITATSQPSEIQRAIEDTGRTAILRGTGASDKSAVSILRQHSSSAVETRVHGLARIVEVSKNLTIVDLSVHGGLQQGKYWLSVRISGDISQGPVSLGTIYQASPTDQEKQKEAPHASAPIAGNIGSIEVDGTGAGSALLNSHASVAELIGRGMLLSPQEPWEIAVEAMKGHSNHKPMVELEYAPNTLVGVIARSAGAWENEKTVCSCTGKSQWEERKEQVMNGML